MNPEASHPRHKPRKRSPNQSDDDDSYRTESTETPRRRKKLKAASSKDLSPKSLFDELTGLKAMNRVMCHMRAYVQDTAAAATAWEEQGDSAEQTRKLFSLAKKWEKKSGFGRLVGLFLRTYGLECINAKARSILMLDTEAPDPYLTADIIRQIAPCLQETRERNALSRWLMFTRKLLKLSDYLLFMPLDGKGTITFKNFERSANEDIQQLVKLLECDPQAQRLGEVGRAFRSCILKGEPFSWQGYSIQRLSTLSQDSLRQLFMVQHGGQSNGPWSQDDLCLEQDLASKESTLPPSEQVLGNDAIVQHDDTDYGVTQISEAATCSSDPTMSQRPPSELPAAANMIPENMVRTITDRPFLKFGIRDERRLEVQKWLSDLDIRSQIDETARLKDLLERIRNMLSPEAAVVLYQALSSLVQGNQCRDPASSHADAGLSDLASPNQSILGCPSWPPQRSQISPDAQDILSIVSAAGGSVDEGFFSHAFTWGEDGELTLVDVPVPGLLTDQRRSTAVNELLRLGHLLMVDHGTLLINPQLTPRLQSSPAWKLAALQAVCRSFPRYPIQVLCAPRCKAMLPTLANVLSHLPELSLDLKLRAAVVEVCISASYFGLLPWKQRMMEYATLINSGDRLSTQRLELRTRMLNRLMSPSAAPAELDTRMSPTNPWENGMFGEQVVFELKLLRDRGASTEYMEKSFGRFQIFGPNPSSREQRVLMVGREIIARAYKNKGRWKKSAALYDEILSENLSASLSPGHEVLASFAEVLCEQHHPDRALRILSNEIGFFRHAVGAKLQLATAHASLMQALIHFQKSRELHEDAIAEALSLYRRYQAPWGTRDQAHLTIVNKTNYYVACAGIAMALHISTLFQNQTKSGTQEHLKNMQQANNRLQGQLGVQKASSKSQEQLEKTQMTEYELQKQLEKMQKVNDGLREETEKMQEANNRPQKRVKGTHEASHTSQEQLERLQEAFKAWEDTKLSASLCWPTPGYAHMIAVYSQSELAHRMGRDDACELRDQAEDISRHTGRQYYFIAQGTIWLDILSGQAVRDGWDAIEIADAVE